MKQVKVKNDFTIGKNYYFKNDTLELSKLKYEQIVKINEKGYIDPLSIKELLEIKKALNKDDKIEKKEEL